MVFTFFSDFNKELIIADEGYYLFVAVHGILAKHLSRADTIT
jgi:hypothetical protein